MFEEQNFFYTFDLNFNEPENQPYIYQIYAIRFCRNILQKLK